MLRIFLLVGAFFVFTVQGIHWKPTELGRKPTFIHYELEGIVSISGRPSFMYDMSFDSGWPLILIRPSTVMNGGIPKPDQILRLEEDAKPVALDSVDENDVDFVPTTQAPSKEWTEKRTPQGTVADRSKLLTDLLTKYNKRVNPDNVRLEFGVNLIDFRVIEPRNALESYVWLRLSWEDSRLQWNPEEYGGVKVLRVDSDALWKPDVTLYNSVDPVNMINCWDTNTVIFPQGKVIYIPPCKMTSQCNLSLRKHPYGNQECIMKFGSWTFDGNVLDLQFYNGTKGIDLSQMMNSSGFEVVSTTGQRQVKYYPCCPDPYPDLTFNLTIKRTPAEELFHRLQ